jgi:hypothetical protein
MNGSSVFPAIAQSAGSSTAAKLYFGGVGARYDYSVCIPAAGNYTLRLRASIGALPSGSYALHLEANGINLGSVSITSTVAGTWVMASTTSVALQAGSQILTLVVDVKGTSELVGDWFELVKQ